MKSKLMVLCLLFLVLSGVCMYYPNRNTGMLGALMVGLVFFIPSVLIKQTNDAKVKKQDTSIVNDREEINLQVQQKQSAAESIEIE
jgi:hypothetical protein